MNYSPLLKDIISKIKTLLLEVLIVNTVIYLFFFFGTLTNFLPRV